MCGRFFLGINNNELNNILKEEYGIENDQLFDIPRYNISPSQDIITIINDGKNNRIGTIKWVFIPSWARDEKFKIINAKAESLSIKPSFKKSYSNKRCVVLAEGFYEWKSSGGKKKPYLFKLKNKKVFSMAGLWSKYFKDDDTTLYTCTIITTKPNDLIKDYHDRMPVILTKEDEKLWLDPSIKDYRKLDSLLKPYNSSLMEIYRVSTIVNSTKNDVKDCIKPL